MHEALQNPIFHALRYHKISPQKNNVLFMHYYRDDDCGVDGLPIF